MSKTTILSLIFGSFFLANAANASGNGPTQEQYDRQMGAAKKLDGVHNNITGRREDTFQSHVQTQQDVSKEFWKYENKAPTKKK